LEIQVDEYSDDIAESQKTWKAQFFGSLMSFSTVDGWDSVDKADPILCVVQVDTDNLPSPEEL
jgi:hypothetical protein